MEEEEHLSLLDEPEPEPEPELENPEPQATQEEEEEGAFPQLKQEMVDIGDKVNKVLQATFEVNSTISQRNQERLLELNEIKDYLPAESYQKCVDALNAAIEKDQQLYNLPPPSRIEFDEANPLDTLRRIRVKLAGDVSNIMSGSIKTE
ncbi:hypothetical protein TRFO_17049 [Tritrichomonas foetus]|uniref:Uncharacterized protein n=1 Tax=Tritrichomonas foetus TaxID=1144522 RepID=A0A1J4KTC3_9EUKA|nr:hypothetical protein TRFO_17049 [Tritrichomonas foetus]|eukprot:OHT12902.1 hypothetical protein TRFO_17049 [Tritrichomonas foetus]